MLEGAIKEIWSFKASLVLDIYRNELGKCTLVIINATGIYISK